MNSALRILEVVTESDERHRCEVLIISYTFTSVRIVVDRLIVSPPLLVV